MINKFKISENHYLTYRENEWDSRVFDKKAFEILDIITNEENADKLLDLFLQKLHSKKVSLLVTIRVNQNNKYLLNIFQKYDFKIVEMSYELVLENLERVQRKKYKNDNNFIQMTKDQLLDVQEIASSVFNFSRYHLDHQLDLNALNQRYKNYIEYMYSTNTPNLIYYAKDNTVSSFLFYSIDKEKSSSTFLLVGSIEGKGFLVPMTYYKVLDKLRSLQIKQVKTLIQADHIDSLKLHLNFGFKIKSVSYGLNKHI